MDETIRNMVSSIDHDRAQVQEIQASIKTNEKMLLQYLVQHNPELITINWAMIRRRLNMVERYKHQHKHINRD